MLKEGVYRIIQESLNNATKHAHAQHVTIQIKGGRPDTLCFSVTDDGIGFVPKTAKAGHGVQGSGFGLKTMEERARALGGVLRVVSAPGEGTGVEVIIPFNFKDTHV